MNVVGYLDGRAKFEDVDQLWEESLGPLILFHRSLDETTKKDSQLAKTVKELYFGSDPISKQTVKQFAKMSGDHMFYGGTEAIVRLLSQSNQINQTYREDHKVVRLFANKNLF
jgi:hypothetical protein